MSVLSETFGKFRINTFEDRKFGKTKLVDIAANEPVIFEGISLLANHFFQIGSLV